ncbi:MAG: signal peptidase II [Acidimicrobiales bacterium]
MRRLQERRAVTALSRPGGRRPLLAALAAAAVVVALDQVTTSLAVAHVHQPTHLLGPLGLTLTYNTGSAFSLFTGDTVVLAALAVVLAAVLVAMARRVGRLSTALALGMVLGGALGNLADRLFRGHGGAVVDFVTLTHWPTFNLADAAITVGVVLLVVLVLFRPAT